MSQDDANKQKSASAFRTIGEVASELGLSPHVLRFWESKFTQIKPHKRRGGHRYYRPADVEVIQEIKSLLYDQGFTIKGAQNFLKEKKKNQGKTTQDDLFGASPAPVAANDSADNSDVKLKKILDEAIEIRNLLRAS